MKINYPLLALAIGAFGTFRHRAGLYDPDAFTHFDQPESRGIFWFGFSRGRKRSAKT